jgi:hypothetical protein
VATDRTALRSIDELASAFGHARALMASGVLNEHEIYHLDKICERIETQVKKKRQEEPVPLQPPPAA